MLDFIFVVENSEEWHKANMKRNPSHYTPLVSISSKHIAFLQDKIPANMWFNTYIPMPTDSNPDRMIKYGVINRENFLRDLLDWTQMYIAGRLHKPISILKSRDSEIEEAVKCNRRSAAWTSLLLLPEKFSEVEMFQCIASLSYVGDPRMMVAENPKKVSINK